MTSSTFPSRPSCSNCSETSVAASVAAAGGYAAGGYAADDHGNHGETSVAASVAAAGGHAAGGYAADDHGNRGTRDGCSLDSPCSSARRRTDRCCIDIAWTCRRRTGSSTCSNFPSGPNSTTAPVHRWGRHPRLLCLPRKNRAFRNRRNRCPGRRSSTWSPRRRPVIKLHSTRRE